MCAPVHESQDLLSCHHMPSKAPNWPDIKKKIKQKKSLNFSHFKCSFLNCGVSYKKVKW